MSVCNPIYFRTGSFCPIFDLEKRIEKLESHHIYQIDEERNIKSYEHNIEELK